MGAESKRRGVDGMILTGAEKDKVADSGWWSEQLTKQIKASPWLKCEILGTEWRFTWRNDAVEIS